MQSADGQTASATATVTVTDGPKPAAPLVLAIASDNTRFAVFYERFRAQAYDLQWRQKTSQGSWQDFCSRGTADSTGTTGWILNVRRILPGTVYQVRYRSRSSSRCDSGTPGEWSEIGEGKTVSASGKPPAPPVLANPDDNEEIIVVFADRFEGGETKAYDFQVRRKTPQGSWVSGCVTFTNDASSDRTRFIEVTLSGNLIRGIICQG